jgi:hypothetical protein
MEILSHEEYVKWECKPPRTGKSVSEMHTYQPVEPQAMFQEERKTIFSSLHCDGNVPRLEE